MSIKGWKKLEDIISLREFFVFLCLFYVMIDIPLALAFNHEPSSIEIALDAGLSLFLLAEFIALQIQRPVEAQSNWDKVCHLLSVIPVLTLASLWSSGPESYFLYFQALHLLRAPQLITTLMRRSKDKLVPKRFKFMAAGYITVLILNTFACGWLIIYPSSDDAITGYVKASYWLVTTIATVGYGDITPSSNLGRVYAMFMMVMGAAVWGILIASASRMMLASDRRKEKHKEKMEALQSFFNHYEIPKKLQGQVVGFYNHLLTKKISEDESAVLNELPAALQGELQVYMNLKPISKVSLFEGVSFECLSQVAKRLEQVFFAPGDVIIKKGEVGQEMYLIGHGSVTIHIADQFIANLGEGQCFGEFSLIENTLRTTDVTAATYCDMFKLSKDRFDELYRNHADLRTNIERIILQRKTKASPVARIDKKSPRRAS